MASSHPAVRIALFAGKAAVSAGLIWLALRQTDLATVADRMAAIPALDLVVALLLLLVMSLVAAWRWALISDAMGVVMGLPRACRILFIGLFFNQTLPSSLGGDAVRVLLVRRDGATLTDAVASVLVDRATGVAALAITAAAGLPVLLGVPALAAPAAVVSLLAVGAILCLALLAWLGGRPPRSGRRVAVLIARVATGIRAAGRPAGRGLLVAALSVAIHLFVVVVAALLLRGLGRPVEFGLLLALVPMVMLFAIVPISIAGWGVREGAMVVALGYAGVAQADALAVSILLGLGLLATGLPGVPLWLATPARASEPS
ncbi:MAG: lysylphosphatidylglycerol synthase transmembrane domain-containing protein [Bauldia litoralis]